MTALALLAFTLVMTVFAVIEPLRKAGLETAQVVALIVYTMPIMLSLTLPIAALFAATMVYGRFSQDNELMACRASGVAVRTLLRPALLLGLLVTGASLWLNNSVIPGLTEGADKALKDNVRRLIYSQFRAQGHVKRGHLLVHASRLHPNADVVEGIVAADTKDPNNVRIVTARQARVVFTPVATAFNDETYVSIQLDEPVLTQSGDPTAISDEELRVPKELQLPSPLKEDPAWYSWGKLLATLRQPTRNQEILLALQEIKRSVAGEMLSRRIAARINAGEDYAGLHGKDKACTLSAAGARVVAGRAELYAADKDGKRRRVRVVITERGSVRTVEADSAQVLTRWWPVVDSFVISVELTGNAKTNVRRAEEKPGATGPIWVSKEHVKIGGLNMPEKLAEEIAKVDPHSLFADPAEFTRNSGVLRRIKSLKGRDIHKLIGKILGEIHGRLAYGVSCFLLVVLGASLGTLFRGGQVLSAFALSVLPAAAVIVMVLMGKEMVSNPDVPRGVGLAAIWGGVLLLGVANLYIHLHLLRK